ncbi:hypothetical protein FHR83_007640 [Actinoplanes campanulatus]|uniref:Uncharacterized protein n=1 Tax=Actinoplanes campanulatus TaxID=113559 RepID=A0A7W5FIQ7_9ACTN|nr:hypothetical protein [Actinoplanes campanulatus]
MHCEQQIWRSSLYRLEYNLFGDFYVPRSQFRLLDYIRYDMRNPSSGGESIQFYESPKRAELQVSA